MLTREQYLLDCIQEECAETSQRASKALRFGLDEIQPGQELDNRQRLEYELSDLLTVCHMLGIKVNADPNPGKIAKVEKYMKLSRERGIVE
jgi:hypothetical protein